MTVLSGRHPGLDRMVSTPRHLSPFQQQMNGLVALLLRLIDEQGAIVLHVTAASAGEGTSTIARGLAVAAAQSSWCKVALLNASEPDDALMPGNARPNILQSHDATKKFSLATEEAGDVSIGVGTLNLSGAAPPNLERMRALYASLRGEFTLTVVDCPPVCGAQAVVAYSTLSDGVLLVVSAERARVADIARARKTLDEFGGTILGTVMNRRRHRLPRFLDRLL